MTSRSDRPRRSSTGLLARLAGAVAPTLVPWLLAACAPQLGSGPGATTATRLVVTRGVPVQRHLLSGELAAERAVDVSAPDVGIRPLEIRWLVENGTAVNAGDLVLEFDNAAVASRLEQNRAAVSQASSSIASTQSDSGTRIAEAEFQLQRRRAELAKVRIDASIPPGLRSDEEYQRLQTALRMAERRLAEAETQLETTRTTAGAAVETQRLQLADGQAKLRQVEGGLARLSLTAPNAGVVLLARNGQQDREWGVGDIVYPGHRIASLPDLSTMIVRARLFDVDDGVLQPGLPAVITLDAHPELTFHGRVRSVDPMAFELYRDSSTRIFWVIVDFDQLDLEHMKPGMSAKVMVELGSSTEGSTDALLAPRESLDLSDPAKARARLADGSWRPVELGACSPFYCVVERGLEEGVGLGRVGAPSAGS